MATNFPNSLDELVNPNSTDSLSNPSHSQQHINLNDAVEAIQSKVGIDGSEDVNSLDYRVSSLEDSNAGSSNEESCAALIISSLINSPTRHVGVVL